jgi:hypothetical protein
MVRVSTLRKLSQIFAATRGESTSFLKTFKNPACLRFRAFFWVQNRCGKSSRPCKFFTGHQKCELRGATCTNWRMIYITRPIISPSSHLCLRHNPPSATKSATLPPDWHPIAQCGRGTCQSEWEEGQQGGSLHTLVWSRPWNPLRPRLHDKERKRRSLLGSVA